jgi:arylsulfatase A-like enzyme
MKRREFIQGSAAATLAAAVSAQNALPAQRDSPPDIIFLLADDLGYADVGAFGARDIKTPAIDGLARDGIKLTDAYAASSVCSPSRIAILTGLYPGRFDAGLDEPIAERLEAGLPPSAGGFAAALRLAGYQTSLVGKWHMGSRPEFSPLQHGYQRFFGFKTGAVDYFTHRGPDGRADFWKDDQPVEVTGYTTDLFADRAVAEIRRMARAPAPMLLSVHFNAPHWPWEDEDDAEVAARLKSIWAYDIGNRATYGRMVQRMDRAIAMILEALDRAGRARNAIVVFTSDNGGERFSDEWPFTGRKGELLEGGIRVPTVVRWPRKIRRGSTSSQPVIGMDWSQTFYAAAGLPATSSGPTDGLNILPALLGGDLPERELFWRYWSPDQRAVRRGRHKYLASAGREYLFDIVDDQMERANLAQARPELLSDLRARWLAWNATMLPYPKPSEPPTRSTLPDRY